jgi:transcriptional regulator with XRE-family HTH domain
LGRGRVKVKEGTVTYLRVKELAERQGLNITTLSFKSRLAYSTVFDFWHDKPLQLNRRTLDRLALALDVTVAELFGGEPAGEKSPGNRRPALCIAA